MPSARCRSQQDTMLAQQQVYDAQQRYYQTAMGSVTAASMAAATTR